MIKQIFIGIIILVFGYLIYDQVTTERIEVVYSITERITTDFTSEEIESIQQITIRNTGDIIAKDIVLKIDGVVNEYQIKPFRHTDSYSVDNSVTNFEIIYSELPPNGEIILNVKSTGSGINYDQLAVYHALGSGIDIFQGQSEVSRYIGFATLIFWFSIAFLPIIALYLDNKYSLKKEASDYPAIFLKKKKPLYISAKFWNEARDIAINLYFQNEITFQPESEYNLTKDSSFKLLNSEIPKYLNSTEWDKIVKLAENIILTRVKLIAANKLGNWSVDYSPDLLNAQKPKHISDEQWKHVISIVSESYITRHLVLLFRDILGLSYREKLTMEKPSIVIEEDWNRYRELAFKFVYLKIIISKFENGYRYDELIELKEYLPDDLVEKLEAVITQYDNLNDREEYYKKLIKTIKLALITKDFESDLSEFEPEDREILNQFRKEVLELHKEGLNSKEEAHKIMSKYEPIKEKVKKQISFIDAILKDPYEIDKIEEYDVPFSEGNWDNLKKLASYLKNQKS